MNDSLTILIGSMFGLLIVALWGHFDNRVEKGMGANIAVTLLGLSLYCGLTGKWIPWGAGSLILAAFVWILILSSSLDHKEPHR